ncbi:MAG: hypothetical protein QOC82_2714 [Frankiaceae bacterium]|jgi:hypothetical protein|nr:hypothetical protein [Frankiaceae bacterium]
MTAPAVTASDDRDLAGSRYDDDGAPAGPDQLLPVSDARLVWATSDEPGRFAAAWWPRSIDAATELRMLLPAVNERLGRTASRVSLNIDAWSADQPRRLHLGDALVRLGWFRTLDPATVSIGHGGKDRLVLLVVPAESGRSAGTQVLRRLASSASWPDDAGEALDDPAVAEQLPTTKGTDQA